jgi:hypothetical protein
MDLTVYFEMLENCIRELGVDPGLCRGQNPGQWNLKRGSADIWVDVFKREQDVFGYFQCMAPVCAIPKVNTEAFFQEVLEINHTLYGVGFTKFKDWLYIKVIRELEGIDQKEMLAMMRRIGSYADDYDDHFKNKYHGNSGPPTGM